MYSYKVSKLPKSTVEIVLIIPKSDIKKENEQAFSRLQKELAVEGFRKGKVPEPIAKKHIKNEVIYQEMLRVVLPKIYNEILTKENLRPIINPKIELTKAKKNEDWEIKISFAEKPEVVLNDYKKVVRDVKQKSKKVDIWLPGKDKKEPKDADDEKNQSNLINPILEAILKEAKVEVSDLIINEELEHRLSKLVDDLQKLGMTVDSYLKSKNITLEKLKETYKKEIEDTYKLEFILSEIADKENITVNKEEINRLLLNIKDEKERKVAEQNSYFYASILRKQKTLDYLINL